MHLFNSKSSIDVSHIGLGHLHGRAMGLDPNLGIVPIQDLGSQSMINSHAIIITLSGTVMKIQNRFSSV